jgi:hypothetical protein
MNEGDTSEIEATFTHYKQTPWNPHTLIRCIFAFYLINSFHTQIKCCILEIHSTLCMRSHGVFLCPSTSVPFGVLLKRSPKGSKQTTDTLHQTQNYKMASPVSQKRVVVCGAGVIGSAVAYYLTTRGVQPIVVERCSVACGASGMYAW